MSLRDRIEHMFTRQVVVEAIEDWQNDRLGNRSARTKVAAFVGGVILATPIILIAWGGWRIAAGFGEVAWVVQGLALIAAGYVTLPIRQRFPGNTLSREELPETFALVDRISDALGAPKIHGIAFDYSYNAYLASVGQLSRKHILGIGFLLWDRLTPEQRLNLLGHEIGHLANKDPARGALLHHALQVLTHWHDLLDGGEARDGFIVTELLLGALAWCVAQLWTLLNSLSNLDSQRAEYLADGLGARIAGRRAAIETLQQSAFQEELDRLVLGYHPRAFKDHDGAGILDYFADGMAAVSPERRAELLDHMEKTKLSVDSTHPPNLYRIAFLAEINLPDRSEIEISPEEMTRINEELTPHRDVHGSKLFGEFFDAHS